MALAAIAIPASQALKELLAENPNISFDQEICQRVCAKNELPRIAQLAVTLEKEGKASIKNLLIGFLTDTRALVFLTEYLRLLNEKHQ